MWLLENFRIIFFLSQNFRPTVQKMVWKSPILKQIQGKIKILSIRNRKWQCLSEDCSFLLRLLFQPTTPLVKPKFHYADFHRNIRGESDKSWNHEVSVKVADTNHESRLHKPSWHVEMFAIKSVTSPRQPVCVALMEFGPLQCTGKVGDKRTERWFYSLSNAMHCIGHTIIITMIARWSNFAQDYNYCPRVAAVASDSQYLHGAYGLGLCQRTG